MSSPSKPSSSSWPNKLSPSSNESSILSSNIISSLSGSMSSSRSSSSCTLKSFSSSSTGSGIIGSSEGPKSGSSLCTGLCGKNSSSSLVSSFWFARLRKNITTAKMINNAGIVINRMRTNGFSSSAPKSNSLSSSSFFAFCCSMISFCLSISSLSCCWISLSWPSWFRTFSSSFEMPVSCALSLLFSTKISSTFLTEDLNWSCSSTSCVPCSVFIEFISFFNSCFASSTSTLRACVTFFCDATISLLVNVPFFFFSHSSSSCSERCFASSGLTLRISASVGIFRYAPSRIWLRF